jgi:hypothetical protein
MARGVFLSAAGFVFFDFFPYWWWRGWVGPLIFFVFICCKLLARWYTVGST